MQFGNTKEALIEKSQPREGDRLISERSFNAILGGTLLYGFALNWVMVKFFSRQAIELVWNIGTTGFFIGYFVLAIIGSLLVASNSAKVSFVGYNLIAAPVGLMLCVALSAYDTVSIKLAVEYTGLVTAVFMAAAVWKPQFFMGLGRVLMMGLVILIIGDLIAAIFTHSLVNMEWLGAALFGMFIGFDWARCTVCQPTANNAVTCAANLYLDIINLFLRILRIVSNSRSK